MDQTLLNKLYGSFLGMNVGIRLGAPVEPAMWTVDRIARTYGDIRGYVKEYKHFAADDDVNGPVFFLRALEDGAGTEVTPHDVAEAFLNYAREGIGMFWWGGLGVSTEHTAYLNLLNCIPAPASGSIRQNGRTIAEQIGGQIFIDTWGMVAAGDAPRAARYARAAASVSHDGEALHGAAFIAGCIAHAFVCDDIERVMDAGLATIPQESLYARVVTAVRDYHNEHPQEGWRACRQMLEEQWGYDRYPGACHVIPNAGVCALALCYGQGDFCRTIEIATMCGWDTDCNAGNVGSVLGALRGIEGIPDYYRAPVNDELILSSASGYLNILDVPTYVWELAAHVYRLRGEAVPDDVLAHIRPGEKSFDFALPGSTHGIVTTDSCLFRLRHENHALEVMWDHMERGQHANVYLKTCYRRSDLSDERYKPVFSPIAYAQQQVQIDASFEKWSGESVCVTPYVRDCVTGEETLLAPVVLREDAEHAFAFAIPQVKSGVVGEVGLRIEGNSPRILFDAGRLLIRSFRIFGPARYTVCVGMMPREFETILPFSQNHGSWRVENDHIEALALRHAEITTGNYFMRDARVSCQVCPRNGVSHLLSLRVQGTRRGYYAGFHGKDTVAILKNDSGRLVTLAKADFAFSLDTLYRMSFVAHDDALSLEIDGQSVVAARDGAYRHGMAGFALHDSGRSDIFDMTIDECPPNV